MVSICRLCASLKKTENLTFIRDTNHDLWQKLNKCCHMSIGLKDILPKGVCPECVNNLNAFYEFHERVHESQQSLKKLLNVDSCSNVTETDENGGEDKDSLAMVAAAVATESEKSVNESPASPRSDFSNNKPESSIENEISDDVARTISEILGVKEEHAAYLLLDSDSNEAGAETQGILEEKDVDELNTENLVITSTFAEGDLMEDDVADDEFIDRYEVIEIDEELEEMDESLLYESMDGENIASIDEGEIKMSPSYAITYPPDGTWTEISWECAVCAEVHASALNLIDHNEREHQVNASEVKWICADCQKPYPRYYSLINHYRQRHRTNLALICDICNVNCSSFYDLERHRQEVHRDEVIPVMILCVICGKGFQTTTSLQMHSKCHLPDEQRLRFSCDLCDKKFRSSSNLKFHQKMHSGTRDYVCDQCGKKFIQRANLEEHLVTHVTKTPYECSICNKFFKTPERLTRHKQRHGDDKPFVCPECGKTFRAKDAMITHLRIHTGEMPFSCEFCNKPFRFRSTLMTHHNVHTGIRPYSCLDCNHHFTNWPNYNKHMKRRHGIDVSSKNPRGKKPTKPAKPLKKPQGIATTITDMNTIMQLKAEKHIAEANEDEPEGDIAAPSQPEDDINNLTEKQELE